jgi:hypothetical protein
VDTNGTANQTMSDDPLDRAMNAEARPLGPRTTFGYITFDIWDCVLQKGRGKVPFDAGQHDPNQRCTAIDFTLIPLSRPGRTEYKIERGLIAESREWANIVKPSLKAIGVDLRGLRDKYVQAQLVPTGGTYTKTNTNTGEKETKDLTTIKFLAVYNTEDECRAAADAFFSQFQRGGNTASAAAAPAPAQPAADPARANAAKFLSGLWKMSGSNLVTFERLLQKTDPVNKFFTLESPEVQAIIVA